MCVCEAFNTSGILEVSFFQHESIFANVEQMTISECKSLYHILGYCLTRILSKKRLKVRQELSLELNPDVIQVEAIVS